MAIFRKYEVIVCLDDDMNDRISDEELKDLLKDSIEGMSMKMEDWEYIPVKQCNVKDGEPI